ncbi:putative membrane protein [Campylobacter iguaniorum]|uniref:hypothetical protein n=1 Tax=Campylobacter iguaniorum TaxID=1244531 RepID=UPI000739FAF4|nr:hypothetical protein [Campylobacter iguaniorum]ALV24945.1 putative membrane protein [Campylobacter iguaniorum]
MSKLFYLVAGIAWIYQFWNILLGISYIYDSFIIGTIVSSLSSIFVGFNGIVYVIFEFIKFGGLSEYGLKCLICFLVICVSLLIAVLITHSRNPNGL